MFPIRDAYISHAATDRALSIIGLSRGDIFVLAITAELKRAAAWCLGASELRVLFGGIIVPLGMRAAAAQTAWDRVCRKNKRGKTCGGSFLLFVFFYWRSDADFVEKCFC